MPHVSSTAEIADEVVGIEVGDVVEQALALLGVEDDPLGRELLEEQVDHRVAATVTVVGVATPATVAVSRR